MARPAFLIFDNETGGLDPRVHPLLSSANLVADTEFNEVEGFSLKLLPPEGTVMEIPTQSTMGLKNFRKKIDTYMDVFTKQEVGGPAPGGFTIQAYAAEVNGFVTLDDSGVWDLSAVDQWLNESLPIEDGCRVYRQFIRQNFDGKPVVCAHNTPFDLKFHYFHLPELREDFAKLPDGNVLFLDTCKMLRTYKKKFKHNFEKGAKLSDLSVCTGRADAETAHEALSDCRDCLAGLKWLIDQAGDPDGSVKLASADSFWPELWERIKKLGGPC